MSAAGFAGADLHPRECITAARPYLAQWLAGRLRGHANVRILMRGDLALLLGAPRLWLKAARASGCRPGYIARAAPLADTSEATVRDESREQLECLWTIESSPVSDVGVRERGLACHVGYEILQLGLPEPETGRRLKRAVKHVAGSASPTSLDKKPGVSQSMKRRAGGVLVHS